MTRPFPRFSIIIPARNEERYLPRCLAGIQKAAAFYSRSLPDASPTLFEIIVVLNRCTDATEQIARNSGALIVEDETKNLAHIRNTGIRAATGEVVITVDADSVMSERMLFEIDRTLRSGKSIGGGVLMFPERYSLGIILTLFCLLPIALYHRISGGLFFAYREDVLAIGGFNETLVSVEDIDFAKRLRLHGKTVGKRFSHLWRAHITTSCRKFDTLGDWYFIKRPAEFISLLRGHNVEVSNKIWYDFPR